MSTVYLLHFSEPIAPGRHTAQHYLGYSDDLQPRVWAHLHGTGARLTQVAKERGLSFVVVRTWEGDRALERKLKNRHGAPRLCPICSGRHPVQMPLLPGECAFIPEDDHEVTQ
jgi:hypothetical protein